MPEVPHAILAVRDLTVTVKDTRRTLLRDVNLEIGPGTLTGVIGPSGAGKSTLLRCLNRLVDLYPGLEVSGRVTFHGLDTRGRGVDADDLRRRIGIVFQQPVTFPGSVEKNVLFAAKQLGLVPRKEEKTLLEQALTRAGLWKEVKDRLDKPATTLSVGQQQRLAIARTLAGRPEVLLLDEPSSALDPRSTEALEETLVALKATTTIVLVTHHL
ncbi:MAG: ATP-binding cassette domain-containing protein, partial [Acidobacteria bacterium]|nr:ATP-binding cassette domain-containing protein [Acidobacteriota bacterium]